MITQRLERDPKTFQNKIILEIPILEEFIADCYMYAAMDAASELKLLVLEEVAKKIDEIVLTHKFGEGLEKDSVKKKLDLIEAAYSNTLIQVKAVQDDSSHWYLMPNELFDEFHRLQEKLYSDNYAEKYDDEEEFESKFRQYRTGGGLNNKQLYIKK